MSLQEVVGLNKNGQPTKYVWSEPNKTAPVPSVAFSATDPTLDGGEIGKLSQLMGQVVRDSLPTIWVFLALGAFAGWKFTPFNDWLSWVIIWSVLCLTTRLIPALVQGYYAHHAFGLVRERYRGTTNQVHNTATKPSGFAFDSASPETAARANGKMPTIVVTDEDKMEAILRWAVLRCYNSSTSEPKKRPWPIVYLKRGELVLLSMQVTPLMWRRCAVILEAAGILTGCVERGKREVICKTYAEAKDKLNVYLPRVRSMTDGDWKRIDDMAREN